MKRKTTLGAAIAAQFVATVFAQTELITNGGFETGNLNGWTVTNSGSGSWTINDGTFDPPGPATPLPPIAGSFDVLTEQGGPGLHLASQCFVVPSAILSATLRWTDRIRNSAASFSDPNQEFRVLIEDASGNLLHEVFSTNPGDPLIQLGPNARSFDLTTVLRGLAGQSVCVSFEEQDDSGFFNVTIDEVSLQVQPPGAGGFRVAAGGGASLRAAPGGALEVVLNNGAGRVDFPFDAAAPFGGGVCIDVAVPPAACAPGEQTLMEWTAMGEFSGRITAEASMVLDSDPGTGDVCVFVTGTGCFGANSQVVVKIRQVDPDTEQLIEVRETIPLTIPMNGTACKVLSFPAGTCFDRRFDFISANCCFRKRVLGATVPITVYDPVTCAPVFMGTVDGNSFEICDESAGEMKVNNIRFEFRDFPAQANPRIEGAGALLAGGAWISGRGDAIVRPQLDLIRVEGVDAGEVESVFGNPGVGGLEWSLASLNGIQTPGSEIAARLETCPLGQPSRTELTVAVTKQSRFCYRATPASGSTVDVRLRNRAGAVVSEIANVAAASLSVCAFSAPIGAGVLGDSVGVYFEHPTGPFFVGGQPRVGSRVEISLPGSLPQVDQQKLCVSTVGVPDIEFVKASFAEVIGGGCPGANGIPRITAPSLPSVGVTFESGLQNAAPNANAFSILGFGVAETPIQLFGCLLPAMTPWSVQGTTTDAAGSSASMWPVPADAGLEGLPIVLQWAVADPQGNFAQILSFSKALRTRVEI